VNVIMNPRLQKSMNSSVGIALGYGLKDRGSRVRFPAGAGNFSLHHRVQIVSEAHPASYPMGTRGSFPFPLTPSSAEVKECVKYTSTPQYVFMAWCLVKHKENFTFIFTMRLYPKISGLASWSENCKWYSSLRLVAVGSLFCESVQ
jgi:hypothetical protein